MSSKKFPRHFLPTLGVLALACAAAQAAEPATPPAAKPPAATPAAPAKPAAPDLTQQLQMASRQYAELQQMLALDGRCQWLEPIARTALDATAQERLAWFNSHGGTEGHAQAAAEEAIAREASLDCKGSKATRLAPGLRYAAWQMRTTWALRGEALLDAKGRPAWFKGKSSVAAQRKALEETAAALEAKYGLSVKDARAGILREATQMLAARCTASDAGCVPAEDGAGQKAYAEQWIKLSEAYAAALAKVQDKVGAPPEQP